MSRVDDRSQITCGVCGRKMPPRSVVPVEMIRESMAETIKKRHPEWPGTGHICLDDLNRLRVEHVEDLLETDRGELSALERRVLENIHNEELLSKNVNQEFEQRLTPGQRLADQFAAAAGSWTFIIVFLCILLGWIALNTIRLLSHPFDPYPYILLNLVLSCVAAIQAPMIMMSQNRQEAKDRLRAEHDYSVNLKAEIEIRALNGKMDELITHQWQRLLEIQQIQMDLLQETSMKGGRPAAPGPEERPGA